eukprot:CAMPEP_0185845754 /NCGR_PEP_ID=MMETSP1354-20130828/1635_1 /TAXON_ID=708628 /ORGANISM="Erythrolobus madagascarensis, Strain CCMP3276" /LENGTH=235 /DNA_ID=CAMNT_0028545791 /DNA_START=146 /DNA_END=853 /DNA_ORIENTATION=-
MKGDLTTAKNDKVEVVESTRFLRLEKISYTTPFGTERHWDRVARVEQESDSSPEDESTSAEKTASACDAVACFCVMSSRQNPEREPETVLVKQFRPAVGKVTVELPAGLVDKGESPGKAALRELAEETGLVGKVLGVSPATYTSPGLSSESVCVVVVKVDLDDEQNQDCLKVVAREEENEFIEIERVPLSKLLQRLDGFSEKGYGIFTGLYSLAFGLSLGWTQLPTIIESGRDAL